MKWLVVMFPATLHLTFTSGLGKKGKEEFLFKTVTPMLDTLYNVTAV
jgi:hypothetical protein